MNQLDRILEVTGRPSAEDIDAIQSPFAATMLDSLPQSDPRPLHHMFPNASPEATDLLSKLLQVGTADRCLSTRSRHAQPIFACLACWVCLFLMYQGTADCLFPHQHRPLCRYSSTRPRGYRRRRRWRIRTWHRSTTRPTSRRTRRSSRSPSMTTRRRADSVHPLEESEHYCLRAVVW